jgi:hypothetical protein
MKFPKGKIAIAKNGEHNFEVGSDIEFIRMDKISESSVYVYVFAGKSINGDFRTIQFLNDKEFNWKE